MFTNQPVLPLKRPRNPQKSTNGTKLPGRRVRSPCQVYLFFMIATSWHRIHLPHLSLLEAVFTLRDPRESTYVTGTTGLLIFPTEAYMAYDRRRTGDVESSLLFIQEPQSPKLP